MAFNRTPTAEVGGRFVSFDELFRIVRNRMIYLPDWDLISTADPHITPTSYPAN
jgi:hypothetical protein